MSFAKHKAPYQDNCGNAVVHDYRENVKATNPKALGGLKITEEAGSLNTLTQFHTHRKTGDQTCIQSLSKCLSVQ